MELVKVTDHSHQSMKDRFRKKIRPEIDTYEIPKTWKSKLRATYTDDGLSSDEELDADVTFNYIDKWNDEFKKCSNKKDLMQSAEMQKRTSLNSSSTRTVVNDPPSDASGVPSSASPTYTDSYAAWLEDSDLTFSHIDEWNDELKECSNKKNLMQSAEVQKRTSPNRSSTKTIVNDPPSDASGAPSSASPMNTDSSSAWLGRKKVANLNDSDVEPLTINNSDNLLWVQRQSGDECDHRSGNLVESDLHQQEVSADKEQGTESADYMFDDMDCLILSEANKCQNLDGADTNSNQADGSRTRVRAISQPKAINIACVEMPPIHSRKVSQHLYNNTEKKDSGKEVIRNIYSDSVKTSSSSKSEGGDVKNCNSSNQQKTASDKVVEVSTDQMNSVNTIRIIFMKGSPTPGIETHSLLSKNHNSKVKDVESDTYCSAKDQKLDENYVKESDEMLPKAVNKKTATRKGSVSKSHSSSSDSVDEPLLHIKASMPNHKSRHVSPVAGPSGVHCLRKKPEKERIHENNVAETSSKKVHTQFSSRKAAVEPHSNSVESADETSNQHPNSHSKAASSTRNKRALGSDDGYDGSTSVSSPHKKKRVQQSSLGIPAAESTRLSIGRLESPPRQGLLSTFLFVF
ncbi:hypothetical protein BsWGS_16217 [Bradybaena similaris]